MTLIAVVLIINLSLFCRLKELHMVSTNLLTVEPHSLGGLRQIRVLNLSNNDLVTLEESSFHSVNSLETLRVDGNPLSCDLSSAVDPAAQTAP